MSSKILILFLASFNCLASEKDVFFDDIDTFLQASQSRKAQVYRLEASSQQVLSKSLQIFTPSVTVTADKYKSLLNAKTSDALKATASWNLFKGGSDYMQLRSNSNAKEALEWQQLNQDLQYEVRAAKLIFRRLYLQEEFQTQTELLHMKEETLKIGKIRYQQGRVPQQELSKMELDLSQQKIRLRELELNVIENEADYKSLFVDELKTKAWPFTMATSVKPSNIEQTPNIKSLTLKTEASRLYWHSRQALHLPSLDLNMVYQRSPLKNLESKDWYATLSLSFPLWSQGEIASASADAFAAYQESKAVSEQAQREENTKSGLWVKKLEAAKANLQESKSNLTKAENLYGDMVRGFQAGKLSTNDLFTEQNRKIMSLSSYAEANLHFHEILAEACAFNGLRLNQCLIH